MVHSLCGLRGDARGGRLRVATTAPPETSGHGGVREGPSERFGEVYSWDSGIDTRFPRPTGAEAEAVLRGCVGSVADRLRIDYELVARARFRDEFLVLPDGSTGIRYNPETGEMTRLR